MGTFITISCNKCKYEKEHYLGVGEAFCEAQKQAEKIVNKVSGIKIKEIAIEKNSEQVYRCFKCNRLYNKTAIEYKLKDSFLFYQIFYKCT